jgi:hypothetical protein
MGPVQVLVVGFDDPTFSGDVLAEFARLRDAGIVRLLDLLLLERGEDGRFDTLAADAELGFDSGRLAAAILGEPDAVATEAADQPTNSDGGPADISSWSLADVIPAGSVAAVALIEHIWATPLLSAIHRAGGTPLEVTWLAPADVSALEALSAVRET